jgi:hypothetical protein
MRDSLPLDDPFFIALLLILLGLAVRYFVLQFFGLIDGRIERLGKKPTKFYLFVEKCCLTIVNWVIPFVLFTFIAVLLGE